MGFELDLVQLPHLYFPGCVNLSKLLNGLLEDRLR